MGGGKANNFKFCSFYNCFSSNHSVMDPELLNKLRTSGTVVGLGGEATRPACKKCGYPGHLTFQCRNFLSANAMTGVVLDVSSTSSEDDDTTTPLTQLRAEELKALQEKLLAREKKAKQKQKKQKKRKRRHDSSSDSTNSESDNNRKEKKHKKKSKKSKSKKKSKDASSP